MNLILLTCMKYFLFQNILCLTQALKAGTFAILETGVVPVKLQVFYKGISKLFCIMIACVWTLQRLKLREVSLTIYLLPCLLASLSATFVQGVISSDHVFDQLHADI